MMRSVILKFGCVILLCMQLQGCSLLKFSISTGDPLSKEDAAARVMTRGFYYDLSGSVIAAADSIAKAASTLDVKVAAIRWKMQATHAAAAAALQSLPDVALADTWIFCRRMEADFAARPDSLLFGAGSAQARAVAVRVSRRAEQLARESLLPARFDLMARFVTEYLKSRPVTRESQPDNTTLAWINFLRANGVERASATGSIAEVLADLSDRVGGQSQQLSNTVGWSKDIFELRMEQDSLRSQIGGQMDSLQRNFARVVVVMERMPEISDTVVANFGAQVRRLIATLNYSVDNVFTNLDRQRDELQSYVSSERKTLVEEGRAAAREVVQAALDELPVVLGKTLLYLILFAVVALGVPFALGFYFGGLRQRSKKDKNSNKI